MGTDSSAFALQVLCTMRQDNEDIADEYILDTVLQACPKQGPSDFGGLVGSDRALLAVTSTFLQMARAWPWW